MTLLTAFLSMMRLLLIKIDKTKKKLLRDASKQRGLSPAGHIKEKNKAIQRIRNTVTKDDFNKNILSEVGIVSLSRDPKNILMWSHYADFHKGFVVEFKIPKKLPLSQRGNIDSWLFPLPITYSEQRPVYKYGIDNDDESLKKLLLTKSDIWSYEQEERVIKSHAWARYSLL